MANLTYHRYLAAGALRINALIGTDAGTLESTYINLPLTALSFQSSIFNFSDAIAALQWGEGKIAEAAAESPNNPLRTYLASATATLTSGSQLPNADAGGVPIIGAYGSVRDGTNPNIICTEADLDEIRKFNELAALGSPVFLLSPYQFKLIGNRIVHTQTSVIIQVCVYNASAQLTAIAGNAVALFPGSFGDAYVAGMLAGLVRDDEFIPQASFYRDAFANTLAGIRSTGLLPIPQPMPAAAAA